MAFSPQVVVVPNVGGTPRGIVPVYQTNAPVTTPQPIPVLSESELKQVCKIQWIH